ncbi:SRPBCC family protein [Gloeobacter kilaueensis]|uniref:Uncharacterized protein n=1 Tax=Gloeobacter kilaueensis (strain ATCC BAA-2537 / CCAP 1431/1 / ULC 316 / JS1) TaxID=1183438 RepID=U5QSP8_GLOK1|nr:SRPBCC family protein [Gloeobacter kilaueensis]AGY60699.1 hypothetical protein GKIL_4453 [Gloeobacter kilaueensis JS1]
MEYVEASGVVARPLAAVWQAHTDPQLLAQVWPSYPPLRVVGPGTIDGPDQFTVQIDLPPPLPPIDWQVEIVRWEPPFRFVDRQARGPFRFWEHTHQFSALDDERTLFVDGISFEYNPLIDGLIVKPALALVLEWRVGRMGEVLGGRIT